MTAKELETFLRHADGDLAVATALAALRRVENGRPGRELGVLSVSAPTLDDQARVAAKSFRNAERRAQAAGVVVRTPLGLYSDEFLGHFSARWAPTQGAENDPKGLNAYHARNLKAAYRVYVDAVRAALREA